MHRKKIGTGDKLCLMILLSAQGLQAEELGPQQEFTLMQMGTQFQISVLAPASVQDQLHAQLDLIALELETLNQTFSDYQPDSLARRISQAAPEWVDVNEDFYLLSNRAKYYAEISAGAFDPTCGALSRLWRRAMQDGMPPKPERLQAAQQSVNWNQLELRPQPAAARLPESRILLDFGGIAKGYAADRILMRLQEIGIEHAAVRCGGDVRLGKPPPGQSGWPVSLQTGIDPNPSNTLNLHSAAVSTSGDLYQSFTWQGKRYAHLFSPRTGQALNGPLACTVIADDATTSDALATTLAVLGPSTEGRALAQSQAVDVRWIHVEPDGTLVTIWFFASQKLSQH